MRIPDHIIDDVRAASDIVDIIGATVRLKKRGKNFLGLCPFHTEKTPSFTVSAEKQMYHCFGCGKGGNVFTYVMETEKVSFAEAVRSLAERAGITIPEEGRTPTPEETEAERLYSVTRFAARVFHDHLSSSEEGKEAFAYFHKRGFTDETIRSFGLGYSLNTWDSFVQKALSEGFSKDELLKTGLARTREDGSLYDYFRGRAMFPIIWTSGRVLGFGARKMREDDPIQGKYINSPETLIYNKSRVLYGLFHAKDAIRQEENAFMVEGYADLISLHQAGVRNVVASSGTALTEEQLHVLNRYTNAITLVYDADAAGSNATLRGIDLALERGFDVRIVTLPAGEDPDSYVQKRGGPEFRTLAERADSFIVYKAARLADTATFHSPEGKTAAIRSIVGSIAKVSDELKRTVFVKDVAQRFDLPESVLFRELERLRGTTRSTTTPPPALTREPRPAETSTQQPPPAMPREMPSEERDLLKLTLEGNPDVLRFIREQVPFEELTDPRVRTLMQFALEQYETTGTVDSQSVVTHVEGEGLKDLATDILMSRYELSRGWQAMEKEIEEPDPMRIAADAVQILRRKSIRRAMDENQHALRVAANAGEDTMEFIHRHQELMRLLRDLETKSK